MNPSKSHRFGQIKTNFLKTRESFYKFVSSLVVEALLIQRPDLQLFTSSLTKAFNELLDQPSKKPKKLPKPISSQDYLRRPMQSVDRLLEKIRKLYLDTIDNNNSVQQPNKKSNNVQSNLNSPFKKFIKEIVELPISIAGIFGFESTLILFDHLDLMDTTIDDTNLVELELDTMEKCQFIISVEDTDRFNRILISKPAEENIKRGTKSLNNKDVQNMPADAKTTKSITAGNRNSNTKKLSNIGSDINKTVDTEKKSQQKLSNTNSKQNEPFSVKSFAEKFTRVPVAGTCYSSFANNVLDIEFEDICEEEENEKNVKNDSASIRNSISSKSIKNFKNLRNNNKRTNKIPIPNIAFKKNISISCDTCAGCPTFVSRFDDICNGLLDLKNVVNKHQRLERAVVLTEKVEILLDLLISFGPDQQAGPPPVKTVTICNKE